MTDYSDLVHTLMGCPVQFREDGLLITAYYGGIRVGAVSSSDNGDGTILLGDIEVKEKVVIRNRWVDRCIRRLRPGWGLIMPRRSKIGTELLTRFIAACDGRGIREIYGNVTPDADREQPFLRDWYGRFGFVITPPDGRDEWFPVAYKTCGSERDTGRIRG